MRILLFFILFGVGYFNVLAQSSNEEYFQYEFIGYIKTSSKQLLTYKIEFNVDDNDSLLGYSTTDLYGENKTKSIIKGFFNTKKKNLFFREVKDVYIPKDVDEEQMCYVNTATLKVKYMRKESVIYGKFYGLFTNQDTCSQGTIYLAGKNLLKSFNLTEDSLRKVDSMVQRSVNIAAPITILKQDDSLTVNCSLPYIDIEIWDGAKEDNDKIRISLNDSVLYDTITIVNKKKNIRIKLPKTQNTLKLTAINNGYIGRNSVNLLVKCRNEEIPVLLYLKKDDSATVSIYKQ